MRDSENRLPLKGSRGGMMPKFDGFKIKARRTAVEPMEQEAEFAVRPIGWFRYIFRCWPYWVGDKVRFRIEVKEKHGDSRALGTLAIYEDLPRPAHWRPLLEPFKLLSNPYAAALSRDGKLPKYLPITGSRINMPGDGRYMIGYPGEPESFEIITFSAKPDETLTAWIFYFFALIVAAITGGVVGAVIGYHIAKSIFA